LASSVHDDPDEAMRSSTPSPAERAAALVLELIAAIRCNAPAQVVAPARRGASLDLRWN